ncbi:MAG TPA: SLBB domain-containing protein, partial [Gemmatimonadaceae bacterium]|nr:SLBB domain-containing protein [Gemmatimonadaceae bacterium]
MKYFTLSGRVVACLIATVAIAPGVFAQVPAPGTPAQAIQQTIGARGLQALVRSRLSASGMTPAAVRQRLAQLGYDPTTLDPYLDSTAAEPPEPTAQTLAVARSLGVLQAPSTEPGQPAPTTPAVTPPALPAPTREEREERLRVFGLSVFARATTQFQPVTTGPVPSTYVIGPGDELVLIITGDVELSYTLPVTREGFIVIPQVGQIWVNGLTLERVRNQLFSHLGRVYSGVRRGPGATTRFDVSLGRLRTNQVFVTGEVAQPGTYLISPVSSVLNALYFAGGPTANGSFRNIQIVRGGRVVYRVDLYDYLLQGNNLDSVRIEPGDVIYAPIHGDHVSIRGEVNRPAIYELKPGETLYQLIRHAGGVTTPAHLRRARITRILPPGERREPGVDRVVIDADVAEVLADSTRGPALQPGDDVQIFAVRTEVRNTVTLSGQVWHSGTYGFRQGMRVWDLIRLGQGLQPDAYLTRAQIVRLDQVRNTLSIVPVSLDTTPSGQPVENPELTEFDELTVFSVQQFERPHVIEVRGAVRRPGTFERYPGMLLRDAILRAGGLDPFTYVDRAFISRLQPDSTRTNIAVQLLVDSLGAVRNDDTLQDFDIVSVYALARYTDTFPVTISGEVRDPRTEAFQEGMTLRDLIVRAGGLRPTADLTVEIARLAEPRERPGGRIAQLIRIRIDSSYIIPAAAARFYLGDPDSLRAPVADAAREFVLRPFDHVTVRRIPEFELPRVVTVLGEVRYPGRYALQTREDRLSDLIVGRAGGLLPTAYAEGARLYRNGSLVDVNVPNALRRTRSRDNVILLPGDSLVVPEYNPVVVVEGAVLTPSTVLYRPGENAEYYIEAAGGYLQNADRGRVAVRQANGHGEVKRRVLFFFHDVPEPRPGSTVIVPAQPADRQRTDWESVLGGL